MDISEMPIFLKCLRSRTRNLTEKTKKKSASEAHINRPALAVAFSISRVALDYLLNIVSMTFGF